MPLPKQVHGHEGGTWTSHLACSAPADWQLPRFLSTTPALPWNCHFPEPQGTASEST